jgi:hypothetical protein
MTEGTEMGRASTQGNAGTAASPHLAHEPTYPNRALPRSGRRRAAATAAIAAAASLASLAGSPADAITRPLDHAGFTSALQTACNRANVQYASVVSLNDREVAAEVLPFYNGVSKILTQFDTRVRALRPAAALDAEVRRSLLAAGTQEKALVARLIRLAKARRYVELEDTRRLMYPAIADRYLEIQEVLVANGDPECSFLPTVSGDSGGSGTAPLPPAPTPTAAPATLPPPTIAPPTPVVTGPLGPFWAKTAGVIWADLAAPDRQALVDLEKAGGGLILNVDGRAFVADEGIGQTLLVQLNRVALQGDIDSVVKAACPGGRASQLLPTAKANTTFQCAAAPGSRVDIVAAQSGRYLVFVFVAPASPGQTAALALLDRVLDGVRSLPA